ncbi:MAG TPA: PaaI family thioesterase [Pyrinomonadaceae bacterium]|nr:PaaI family thioesterase [Pyrinomonadaceae bacterium]
MIDDDSLSAAQLYQLREALDRVPFARLLGIELVAAGQGTATLRLPITDDLRQIHGVMHGGAIASLIDTATAFAIVPMLGVEEKFSTVDLTVNYLRPLMKGTATAQARVLRFGRRLITVAADVLDDSGDLSATALSTYAKLG